MIQEYTVAQGQNLMDVVLSTYGSLDGLTDFLLHNPDIDLNSILYNGQIVKYEQSNVINEITVNYYQSKKIQPCNNERSVYFKQPTLPLFLYVLIPNNTVYVGADISCDGYFEVDWGDDTVIESYSGSVFISHNMNSKIQSDRIIKIYSSSPFQKISFNNMPIKKIFTFQDIRVYEFNSMASRELENINHLIIPSSLRDIRLTGSKITSLNPLIGQLSLRNIYIDGCGITQRLIDEFVIGLVKKYSTRLIGYVKLDGNDLPSGEYKRPASLQDPKSGWEAIWVLENERGWDFDFNNTVLPYELNFRLIK